MSRIMEILEHPHTKMFLASLATVAVVGGTIYYLKKNELLCFKAQPKKWHKVGVVSGNLYIFPIKSCGPIVANEFDCKNLGPEKGHLRDRVFMVMRSSNHEFVTARTYPRMVLIMPRIEDNILTIDAPGMDELSIDIETLYQSTNTVTVMLRKDPALVIDCGDEIAKWLSKFLLNRDEGMRLVFYPSSEPKPFIADKNYLYKTADREDTGSLHDETSYMLMNARSFDDLNEKLEKPIVPLQMRPNIVVKGPKAWDEDKWKFVKIGEDAIFRNIQPCTRCMLTTIDPSTGERNKDEQPIKTLRKFRCFQNICNKSPVFGIHLGLRSTGASIKTGDSVYVSY